MNEAPPTELCDCPRRDHTGSENGCCLSPSIRSEEADDTEVDYSRYSECGCCMADCPDVHPTPTPGFGPVPGSLVVAKEHFDTLPEENQQALREQEAPRRAADRSAGRDAAAGEGRMRRAVVDGAVRAGTHPRRAARFYGAILDAEPDAEKHGSGPEHFSVTGLDGLVIELYPATSRPPTTTRLEFHGPDIDAAVQRLMDRAHALPERTRDGTGWWCHDVS